MRLDVQQMVESGAMRNAECVDACRRHAIHYSFSAGHD